MSLNFQDFERDIVAKSNIYLVSGLEPEDVAQELRIQLWLKRECYRDGKGASPRTFASRIMMNRIKNLWKFASRQKRLIDQNHFIFSELESTPEGMTMLEGGTLIS